MGLAFKIKLRSGDTERLNGRGQMSVGYTELDVETRNIEGTDVRLIRAVALSEISACYTGAVKQTHGIIRDAEMTGRLQDDVRSKFPSDSTAAAFTRALHKLQNAQ